MLPLMDGFICAPWSRSCPTGVAQSPTGHGGGRGLCTAACTIHGRIPVCATATWGPRTSGLHGSHRFALARAHSARRLRPRPLAFPLISLASLSLLTFRKKVKTKKTHTQTVVYFLLKEKGNQEARHGWGANLSQVFHLYLFFIFRYDTLCHFIL